MKNKNILIIGIGSLIVFIGIASFLWYSYFNDYERKTLEQNSEYEFIKSVELVNSGAIDYINATNLDDDSIIPTYYFRVKNSADKSFNYVLYFENAIVNDGCTDSTRFTRNELEYELKLDNKVIKQGGLDTIVNNVLYINTIDNKAYHDYSLKVKLKESVTDYSDKHFHYVVKMKEKE